MIYLHAFPLPRRCSNLPAGSHTNWDGERGKTWNACQPPRANMISHKSPPGMHQAGCVSSQHGDQPVAATEPSSCPRLWLRQLPAPLRAPCRASSQQAVRACGRQYPAYGRQRAVSSRQHLQGESTSVAATVAILAWIMVELLLSSVCAFAGETITEGQPPKLSTGRKMRTPPNGMGEPLQSGLGGTQPDSINI